MKSHFKKILLIIGVLFLVNFKSSAKTSAFIGDTIEVNNYLTKSKELIFSLEYKKAYVLLDSAISLAIKLHYVEGEANGYNVKGLALGYEGKFEDALKFHLKSLKLRESLNSNKDIAKSYLNIGVVFLDMKNYSMAIQYLNKSLSLLNNTDNDQLKALCYNNLGLCYDILNLHAKSLENYLIAYGYSQKINDKNLLARIENNIGGNYESNQDTLNALIYYLKCENTLNQIIDVQLQFDCFMNLGNLYLATGQPNKSKIYATKTLALLETNSFQSRFFKSYRFLSAYYEKNGNTNEALRFLKLYDESKDTLYNTNLTKTVNELNAKFDLEKKNSKIQLLQIESEKKGIALNEEKNKKRFIIYLSVILFSFISIIVLFYLKSIKQKQNIKLALTEKEKLKAELTLLKNQISPHMMFNALNSIHFQIDENHKAAKESILIFSDLLRYQLYECGESFISIEKEINYITKYIEMSKLSKSDRCKIEYKFTDDSTNLAIAPLLFIPIVENAFKYVTNEKNQLNFINITLETQTNKLIFKVENSKYETETTFKRDGGIGLSNLKNRLELLYPNKHELIILNTKDLYIATLIITY